MTFFKLCKYDLKNGMFKEGIKYLACVVLFLGFCIGFIYTKGKDLGARTFGDYLFFITAGMEEYIPMPGNIFMFPLKLAKLMLPSEVIDYFGLTEIPDAYDFGTAIYHTLLSVL